MGSHLIFQLVLPVHLMLGDIEVVGGVIINRLYKAENVEDRIFQYLRRLENFKSVERMASTRTKTVTAETYYSHSQFIE